MVLVMEVPPMPDPVDSEWLCFLEWLHLDGMHVSELRHVVEKSWKYEDLWAAYCEQREMDR